MSAETATRDGPGAGGRYLDHYMAPLLPFLARDDVTDLYVNRPGELWVETLGGATLRIDLPALTPTMLWHLARQIASQARQGINREHPLLAATLPDGARIQVVAPTATRGDMAMAIRKQAMPDLVLADYARHGALHDVLVSPRPARERQLTAPVDADPETLIRFLGDAVRARRTIMVAGGTATGKTTFLNALIKEIPLDERLILIEDTAELRMPHRNAVGLIAARGALGEARITVEDLLQATLRMRPDRILLGELRGAEAFSFLRAVNIGHPGSLTTIHADSPEGAIEQLALLILQSGTPLRHADIVRYCASGIDYVVQLERSAGVRRVSRIMPMRG